MSLSSRVIVPVERTEQLAKAAGLIAEYGDEIQLAICKASIAEELQMLAETYSSAKGRLFIALDEDSGEAVGTAALLDRGEGVCEMRRLYVTPRMRGTGLGRELAHHVIAAARDAGYTRLMLHTVPGHMDAAIALYRALGFRDCECCREGFSAMELPLR